MRPRQIIPFIWDMLAAAAFANDAALAAVIVDGTLTRRRTIVRAADGQATGLLRENAQDLVERSIADYIQLCKRRNNSAKPTGTGPTRRQSCVGSQRHLFSCAGASFEEIDFSEFRGKPTCRRLYVMVRAESNEELVSAYQTITCRQNLTTSLLCAQLSGKSMAP